MGLLDGLGKLLDVSDPRTALAWQLINAKQGGEVGGLLGQFAQQNEKRKQRQLQEEMQRQQMEAQRMQMEMSGIQLQQARQGQEDEQAFRGVNAQMPNFAAPAAPNMAPTPENAAQLKTLSPYEQAAKTVEYYRSKKIPEKFIKPYVDQMEKMRPKFKADQQIVKMPDGSLGLLNLADDGTPQVVPHTPAEKQKDVNLGGSVSMVGEYSGKPGQSLNKTLSPSDLFQGQVSMRGQNMTDARSREQFNRGTYDSDRGGFVTPSGFAGIPNLPAGTKSREDADGLRKEFNSLPEVKNFKDIAAIYNAAKKAPDTPAGDFALIYGVGKILDPDSVVREGEMSLVMKSGSPAQRVMGHLNYLRGKGRLTPELRNELTVMLNDAASERKSLYDRARQTYGGVAKQRGYREEDVFIASPDVAAPKSKAVKMGGKNVEAKQAPDGNYYIQFGDKWFRVDE